MHYGDAGDMTEVFNKTMTNHLAYDKLHGYPSFVLASDIYNGLFNKPLFLSQIMAEELEKSEDERLEWLLCVDRQYQNEQAHPTDYSQLDGCGHGHHEPSYSTRNILTARRRKPR